MPVDAFQNILLNAFPECTWGKIAIGIRDGIKLADAVIDNVPLLKFSTGQDLRGHLRRAGILYNLHEVCRLGELPFRAEPAKMPIGYWHWIDIRSGQVIAHVIKTDSKRHIPDITSNRQPKFLKNEYDFFEVSSIPPLHQILAETEDRYSAITFGASSEGELTHASIGMPSADGNEWLGFIDLLKGSKGQALPATPRLPPSSPSPDPTTKVKFQRHVEEMLESKTNQKTDEKSA